MKESRISSIYIILLILIIVWALSWPVSKIGLQYMPPFWFAFARILVGIATMLGFLLLAKKLSLPSLKDLPLIISLGVLQIGLFLVLINIGLRYVSAGQSAILVYTTPLWVAPVAIIWFHEKLSWLKFLGILLGLLGIVILLNPWHLNWENKGALFGIGILLLAAIAWAISILIARYSQWHSSPLELIIWQLLVALIGVGAFTFIMEPHPHITWNTSLILSILYNGILSTAFGYWGTMAVSKALPSITTSLALVGVPVLGVVFSTLILHEALTLNVILSLASIIAGMSCLFLAKR